jgi:hypothetical protein
LGHELLHCVSRHMATCSDIKAHPIIPGSFPLML